MQNHRIEMLDGWRALSILLVLAGHWLPIGPKQWQLNGATAATGMVMFFVLSGFLITRLLLSNPDVPNFLIRRLFRIVPLAYVAMMVLAVWNVSDLGILSSNLLFLANLPPQHLFAGGEHLWSLCVEMQFYIGIAVIVAFAGRKGLYSIPILALCVTGLRIAQDAEMSIITWQRVDEILAGGTVALLAANQNIVAWLKRLPVATPLALLPLVFLSAHPASGALNFSRPYLAAAMIGVSLFSAPAAMSRLFQLRPVIYIAQVSYALYVVHGILAAGWLGSGERLVKYAKRPALVLATFGLAHLSTFYFEARMIRLGKATAKRWAVWRNSGDVKGAA